MEQLNLSGQTKEEEAIAFIREHEPSEGYFLAFSGGKDSIVLHHLAQKAGVKFLAGYSATGIDPPELVRFIRDHYPDVKWYRPKYSFYEGIKRKGFPMRFARWCCNHLKKDPTRHIGLHHRLMGIRAEESAMRRKRPRIEKYSKYAAMIYKPIFHWLEWEIWDYIEKYNLPYCPLYDEGFDRLGCVVCPFICYGKNYPKVKRNMDRWPGIYRAFEHAMTELWYDREWWRQTKQRRAMLPDEFIRNWYRGK